MERRSHEFGTYVMLGMKKRSLFQMLFLEDSAKYCVCACDRDPGGAADLGTYKPDYGEACRIWNSASSVTFSGSAALWTVIGICGIKMLARFVLCIKLWKKEVYELLSREQKEKQRAFSPIKTCVKLMMGIILLAVAMGSDAGY